MNQKQFAPATARNRDPILAVLKKVLPPTGTVLEIASGTGEHAVYFAPHLRPRHWIPSDINPASLESIRAWQGEFPSDCLSPPLEIDVRSDNWWQGVATDVSAIACINLIHIAPWSACEGLMTGAGQLLPPGGILYLYGPFKQEGVHTAASNASFDESLQQQNPEWGVRHLEDVVSLAKAHHLEWQDAIAMPANNLSVVFRRQTNNE